MTDEGWSGDDSVVYLEVYQASTLFTLVMRVDSVPLVSSPTKSHKKAFLVDGAQSPFTTSSSFTLSSSYFLAF